MRASRLQVDQAFARLVAKLGPRARGWALEHVSEYGGYVVTSDHGSGRPLGHQRRSGAEMVAAIWFALDVLFWTPALEAGCECAAVSQ